MSNECYIPKPQHNLVRNDEKQDCQIHFLPTFVSAQFDNKCKKILHAWNVNFQEYKNFEIDSYVS